MLHFLEYPVLQLDDEQLEGVSLRLLPTKLQHLSFSRCEVPATSLHECTGVFSNLHSLTFRRCPSVTDAHLQSFGKLNTLQRFAPKLIAYVADRFAAGVLPCAERWQKLRKFNPETSKSRVGSLRLVGQIRPRWPFNLVRSRINSNHKRNSKVCRYLDKRLREACLTLFQFSILIHSLFKKVWYVLCSMFHHLKKL